MKNIAIIGSGTWGVALSIHLANKGHNIKIWSFTEEETNIINDYLSDLKALTEEKTAHWLSDGGIEDEWDDYVSAMDSMGLQEVVAAWQAAYDRYVEAQ